MTRATRLALACYPPSWKERYGEELAAMADDRPGTAADLLVGAARAWLHPAGTRTAAARRVSALCTVHVTWCFAFVAVIGYLKAVNDPPLSGLTTGASQPLWGLEKAVFFLGWAVLLLAGTVLLVRIAVPAVRRRDWQLLRPMLPPAVLLVVVLGSIPWVGSYGDGAPTPGPVLVVLTWLALGLALVVTGAVGPVAVLRRSGLPPAAALPAAVVVAACLLVLALSAVAQAAVLSGVAPIEALVQMWGGVAMLLVAAATSTVSVGRALRP